jgi:hypothetical protein
VRTDTFSLEMQADQAEPEENFEEETEVMGFSPGSSPATSPNVKATTHSPSPEVKPKQILPAPAPLPVAPSCLAVVR